jgi:hypothetical protein
MIHPKCKPLSGQNTGRTEEGDPGVRHSTDSLQERRKREGYFDESRFNRIESDFRCPSNLPGTDLEVEVASLVAYVSFESLDFYQIPQISVILPGINVEYHENEVPDFRSPWGKVCMRTTSFVSLPFASVEAST